MEIAMWIKVVLFLIILVISYFVLRYYDNDPIEAVVESFQEIEDMPDVDEEYQDIVRKIIAKGADPLTTKIENHMEKNLITISPEKDIFDAITLMANRNIKQLPVMDGDVMLGLLTQKDVLKIDPELFDLLVDKLEIREEPHKPIMNEGLCSDCGNYSDRLIKNNDSLLCNKCNK